MKLLLTALLFPITALAQGDINPPPGAPVASMKTLAQIEARTPISTVTNITVKGSYYLTGNITVATGSVITINVAGVSIDLNGFTINSTSASPSGSAIAVNASDATITNGHIAGPGFVNGIYGTTPNVSVSNVSVLNCQSRGISVNADSTSVKNCAVHTITSTSFFDSIGISAESVSHSSATDCASYGISGTVITNCVGNVNASGGPNGSGIGGSIISDCIAENLGAGLGITGGSISNSSATSNTGTAINAKVAQNCQAYSTNGTALICDTATNCSAGTSNVVAIVAKIASFCNAGRSAGGVTIQATNAIGCTVGSGGTVTAPNKSLGTP